jgi:hypothetical protein
MKHESKHTSQEEIHLREQHSHAEAQQGSMRTFATAEEALRQDRSTVEVPPAVEQRLSQSIESLPKPGKPWWKRWMGQ